MKKVNFEQYTTKDFEKELKHQKYKKRYNHTMRNTIYVLVTVAAISVLLTVLFFPVLQVYGSSMTPSLNDGEIVVCMKTDNVKQGDIVAFYYNNKILVKRVVGTPSDWINIDEKGNVYVNQELLEEDYIETKALGNCDIELPYQVPENRYFVLGDHRDVSVDSRNTTIGCVSEEQMVGKLVLKVWPLEDIKILK